MADTRKITEINAYITARYGRWMDYARFHSKRAGHGDDPADVLNEVLCSLLCKDTDTLSGLLRRRKDDYAELDWFVMRMLRLNIYSPSSPFRQKDGRAHIDPKTDVNALEIADLPDSGEDRAGRILQEMNMVRRILAELPIPERWREIFAFRFFGDEPFRCWPGKESMTKLYTIHRQVEGMIRQRWLALPDREKKKADIFY